MQICKKCNFNKDYSLFSKWSQSKTGYKPYCKECISKEHRENKIKKGKKVKFITVENESQKQCSNCLELIDKDKFSKSLKTWCSSCAKVYNRKYTKGVERFIPLIFEDSKQCCNCKEIKLLENFSNSKRGRLGKSSYCKSCTNILAKAKWRNPERERIKTRNYRKNNREKYLATHRIHQFNRINRIKITNDGTITVDFLKSIYNSEECYYCKKPVIINERTLEHLQPLIKGGLHTASNIKMACKSCNLSKQSKTEIEYLTYLSKINESSK
jgi:hypothetical protein